MAQASLTQFITENPTFELGQRVIDMHQDDEPECIVVETRNIPADQYEIPALDGKTVAQCNPRKWKNDPVIEVVYVSSADYRLDDWSPTWLVETYQNGHLESIGGLRVYHLPAGRLEIRTSEDDIERAESESKAVS
jgi:hypothetical protein